MVVFKVLTLTNERRIRMEDKLSIWEVITIVITIIVLLSMAMIV